MYLVVGLGNPGKKYFRTRHNIGFRVLDVIAEQQKCSFQPGKGSYWLAECSLKNTNVVLLKPATYMNNSGQAVIEFLEDQPLPLSHILVVYDDIHLPLGTIRVRLRGSDGGHHGVASIIYSLGSNAFPRVRIGIAPNNGSFDPQQMAEFVLSEFDDSEQTIAEKMIVYGAEAVISFIEYGNTYTMNTYNKSFFN